MKHLTFFLFGIISCVPLPLFAADEAKPEAPVAAPSGGTPAPAESGTNSSEPDCK